MAVAERALADQAGARASRGRLSGQRLMLLGLVLLALALRLWGIGFGLPRTYHPDEPAHVLQALAVARGLPGGLRRGVLGRPPGRNSPPSIPVCRPIRYPRPEPSGVV